MDLPAALLLIAFASLLASVTGGIHGGGLVAVVGLLVLLLTRGLLAKTSRARGWPPTHLRAFVATSISSSSAHEPAMPSPVLTSHIRTRRSKERARRDHWNQLKTLGEELRREAAEDRLNGLAAEVAFFAVLSIFPGLIMLASALGSLDFLLGNDIANESQALVLDFLNRILTEQAAGAVRAVEELFEEDSGGLLTVSALFALSALTRGFSAVIRALNVAYDKEDARSWLVRRLVAAMLAAGSVIIATLLLAAFVTGPLLGAGHAVSETIGLGPGFALLWNWIRWPAAFAVLIAWATALYQLGLNLKTSPRQNLPGAILSAVLWLLVSVCFSVYLRLASAGNPILGALGGAFILLIWLYLLSFALLVGGEFNSVLARRRAETQQEAPHARGD